MYGSVTGFSDLNFHYTNNNGQAALAPFGVLRRCGESVMMTGGLDLRHGTILAASAKTLLTRLAAQSAGFSWAGCSSTLQAIPGSNEQDPSFLGLAIVSCRVVMAYQELKGGRHSSRFWYIL
jgi:hypothetical protein